VQKHSSTTKYANQGSVKVETPNAHIVLDLAFRTRGNHRIEPWSADPSMRRRAAARGSPVSPRAALSGDSVLGNEIVVVPSKRTTMNTSRNASLLVTVNGLFVGYASLIRAFKDNRELIEPEFIVWFGDYELLVAPAAYGSLSRPRRFGFPVIRCSPRRMGSPLMRR
jgi:hypothetical protein